MKDLKQILIVEDEPTCQVLLQQALIPQFQVHIVSNLSRAKEVLKRLTPDLILLDLYLPDGDGFELIHFIKEQPELSLLPIILLTSEGDVQIKVRSFAEGVYDFVTKPFHSVELIARIESHLGRALEIKSAQTKPSQVGALVLNTSAQKISIAGEQAEDLNLSPIEYKILRYLMNNEGRVRTRDQLAEFVWNRKILSKSNN